MTDAEQGKGKGRLSSMFDASDATRRHINCQRQSYIAHESDEIMLKARNNPAPVEWTNTRICLTYHNSRSLFSSLRVVASADMTVRCKRLCSPGVADVTKAHLALRGERYERKQSRNDDYVFRPKDDVKDKGARSTRNSECTESQVGC